MAIKFKRRLRAKATVDMAPMIDIIFQLIIFFMFATTFKTTTGMELKLPQAENVSQIMETPLKITIIDRDNIFISGKKVKFNEVDSVIKNIISESKGDRKSVVLYGDRRMEYQLLIDMMDLLKEYGYDSLDLALENK